MVLYMLSVGLEAKRKYRKGVTGFGRPLKYTLLLSKIMTSRTKNYDFYKTQGICVICRKQDAVQDEVMCESCKADHMESYYFKKSHGICICCGQYDAVPGKTECEVCAAKGAERKARKLERMTIEEKEQYLKKCSQANRKVYHRRKAAGLCTKCGRPQAKNSTTLCSVCLLKARESDRRRRNKRRKDTIPRVELPNYGICYQCCKNPIMEGKRLCADCYGRTLASLQIARVSDGGRESREYFRELNRLVFMKQTSSL